MAKQFSGLKTSDTTSGKGMLRDTRTISKRIYDYYEEPRNAAVNILFVCMIVFIFPSLVELGFLMGVIMFLRGSSRKPKLPFRMPIRAKMLDYNDPKAGSSTPQPARGICFYGNDIETNEELWFNNDDMRTHTLMLGSTGSGKTETLISIGCNALVQGSGFIYVDGKGDNTLFAKVFSLARMLGREDDLLIINFMTGARDIIGPQERRLSNTLNPFSMGSSSMLSQLVVSMMSSASHTPDGDMWKGRAIAFVEALMKMLVYMRDQGSILLDANTIRHYFSLEYLESIVIDKVFPRVNREPISLVDLPPEVIEPLYNYVVNLPGYDKSRKGKQVSQVLEQHGFITMQLVRVFTSLADTYGHILRTKLAEVDLKDVVLNRRILVVLLPALEKSPDELANLGKVIIASLKSMMAAGLGEEVEGSYKDLITRKPTNSPTPFLCILDEYGYYAVPGFAVVPAQARSLGFSVIFAGQDLPAFQKASKEEAASIGANTNIKIALKLEDPVETWDFFQKTAGMAWVARTSTFKFDVNAPIYNFKDEGTASFETRNRITLGDLKEQREGEAHIFFKSGIVRAKMFFANPKPITRFRLNHLLKIEKPLSNKLLEFKKEVDHFIAVVEKGTINFGEPEFNADIDLVARTFKEDASGPTLIERGVAALLAFYNRTMGIVEETKAVETEEIKEGEVDIFSRPLLDALVHKIIPASQFENFSKALLQKSVCSKYIQFIERLFGKTEVYAVSVANEIVKDIELATHYPSIIKEPMSAESLVPLMNELAEVLQKMRTE
jgi:intracellular multiplication protein IcmO